MTTEIAIGNEVVREAFLLAELAEGRRYWMKEDGTLVFRRGIE